jgi:tripartite-type tricarboxylate transporter receptor subunit TctC
VVTPPPVRPVIAPQEPVINRNTYYAAGDYPSRPIRLVVPFPPGGSLDIVARLLAPKMSALLGTAVIVDNKPGAGGAIGMSAVAQQKPDGYTLGIASSATMTMMPAINSENSGYSPIQSFTPIAHMVAMPSVLTINASFPARDFGGFMATVKQTKAKYSYASAGVGSASHMQMELFALHSNTHFVHTPYRGVAPAIQDVISGQVPIIFEGLVSVLPHIQAGKLVPIAVIAPQRLPQLPNVPTLTELGFAGANRMPFTGIVAPKGIPQNVENVLSATIAETLKDPTIRNRLEEFSTIILNGPANQMAQQISEDLSAYLQLAKQRNLSQP